MPLWLKWVLSLLAFAALTAGVVIFAGRSNDGEQTYSESRAAAAQANSEGQAVSAQDQAAHQAQLAPSVVPRPALQRAIMLDMRMRVARHDVTGPVQRVRCNTLPRKRLYRVPFGCYAVVGGFRYPFVGVADLRTHLLTWCKDDRASYDPSVEAPLSGACTS